MTEAFSMGPNQTKVGLGCTKIRVRTIQHEHPAIHPGQPIPDGSTDHSAARDDYVIFEGHSMPTPGDRREFGDRRLQVQRALQVVAVVHAVAVYPHLLQAE
ncbi:hypothetical protein D3C81_1087500 [compost metagenome]